jgi:hypothetical protein
VPVEKNRRGKPSVRKPVLVFSTEPDAQQRRYIEPDPIPAAPSQPYLIINDHPAKLDLEVAAEVERQLRSYRNKGWQLVTNDESEVKVRSHITGYKPGDKISPILHTTLAEANLGGVILITGKASDEPVNKRVQITRIDGEPVTLVPEPPAEPLPPAQAEAQTGPTI